MAKFTALLFSYDAPGKRMKKGDIICIEPYKHPWSPKEMNSHEVVTLDGITEFEIAGLIERIFDLNNYEEYKPLIFNEFKEKYSNLLLVEQMKKYTEYIESEKQRCSEPTKYLAKRRFKIDGIGTITKTQIYDRLRRRYVLESDKLNEIKPLVL